MNHGYIKSYPDLGQAALKNDLAIPYRIWLVARHIDRVSFDGQARSYVEVDHLLSVLRLYGMSKAHLRYALDFPGSDIFYRLDKIHNRLIYTSAMKVALALGVPTVADPVFMESGWIKSISDFKAWTYATWFTQPRQITREKLEDLFGTSAETLRRWENKTGMDVGHNVARANASLFGVDKLPVPVDTRWHKDDSSYYWIETIDGQEYICWQTANTYHQKHRVFQGHRGQGRKIAKAVRASLKGAQKTGGAKESNRVFVQRSMLPESSAPAKTVQGGCVIESDEFVRNRLGKNRVWDYSLMMPKKLRYVTA